MKGNTEHHITDIGVMIFIHMTIQTNLIFINEQMGPSLCTDMTQTQQRVNASNAQIMDGCVVGLNVYRRICCTVDLIINKKKY